MRRSVMLLAACTGATATLSGCSISFPGPSLLSEDMTASIESKPVPLAAGLNDEDDRRSTAAVGAALDPASHGVAVSWNNPASGSHGAFTPVSAPYPRAKLTCRAFLADVTVAAGSQISLQGTACRLKESAWFIRDVKPFAASRS